MDSDRKGRLTRRIFAIVAGVLVLWIAGCALIYSQMCKSPEQFGMFMKKIPEPVAFLAFPFESMWMSARGGTLQAGDNAPDFTLRKLHEEQTIRLSSLTSEKPVVLIFGSYT